MFCAEKIISKDNKDRFQGYSVRLRNQLDVYMGSWVERKNEDSLGSGWDSEAKSP